MIKAKLVLLGFGRCEAKEMTLSYRMVSWNQTQNSVDS